MFMTTRVHYYHWVDSSAGGILVPEGIIPPVVGIWEVTWLLDIYIIEIYSSLIM